MASCLLDGHIHLWMSRAAMDQRTTMLMGPGLGEFLVKLDRCILTQYLGPSIVTNGFERAGESKAES